MIHLLFYLSLALIAYCYFGYPLLCWVLALWRREWLPPKVDDLPTVSLIIAAYNEEQVIGAKLDNARQLDYPGDRLQIIVASDASTDRTDEIVAARGDQGIVLNILPLRGGKTAALNAAVPKATGEILVFSDANGMYRPDALKRLVPWFQNKKVGGVSGELNYENPGGRSRVEGEVYYWSYERFLKRLESRLGSILGANGSIYAIRRELFVPLDPGLIDDLVLPLTICKRGFQVKYEPRAISVEESSRSFEEEFARKKRIISQGLRAVAAHADLLNPFRHRFLSFQLISHKLLRWMVSLLLIVLFVSNLFLLDQPLFALAAGVQIGFYGLAAIGGLFRKHLGDVRLFHIPFYFCMTYGAALYGLGLFLLGRTPVAWETARQDDSDGGGRV